MKDMMCEYYNRALAQPLDDGERTIQWLDPLKETPEEGEEIIQSVLCKDGKIKTMVGEYKDGTYRVGGDGTAVRLKYWARLPEPAEHIYPKHEVRWTDLNE